MIVSENFKIWLTYMIDKKAIEEKISFRHEHTLALLNTLRLSDYSTSVQELIIIIVAQSEQIYAEQEKLFFRKKQNKIEIYISLDYQKILQASENQVLEMIAETYLQAIKRFLSKRKDFDHQRFYSDLENLFIQHGYLLTKT